MDIEVVDFTLHVRDKVEDERLQELERGVHALEGVVSTHRSDEHPQLMLVAINRGRTTSADVLEYLARQGVQADLYVPEHI